MSAPQKPDATTAGRITRARAELTAGDYRAAKAHALVAGADALVAIAAAMQVPGAELDPAMDLGEEPAGTPFALAAAKAQLVELIHARILKALELWTHRVQLILPGPTDLTPDLADHITQQLMAETR
ncbi:hypothetical protein [Mycolicibacterium palauense]|uniref:hypothetical protein n=1 Tax=Mycolicibacterium palauense TaxID=2034511 RepID=UPI000BFEB27F|nr:hypothetical protein [Mycolicibacterium palauense]